TVRTHHLHMAEPGGEFWNDELLFRDYLRDHPDEARRYEQLKHDMAQKHRFERTQYTASKSEYILSVLNKARKEQEK
ncbi:MAG: GrpB family protein, partial [Armatimonadota bacterium]|nr:GrpB family protein [Armatimonadota bacterium]